MTQRLWLRRRFSTYVDCVVRGIGIVGVGLLISLSVNVDRLFAASPSLADRVIEHKLANGLTVLMVERHQSPVVSINITFAVGGINEQVG